MNLTNEYTLHALDLILDPPIGIENSEKSLHLSTAAR